MPDATRWHHAARYRRLGTTPPPGSVHRVLGFANFHLNPAAPWQEALVQDGRVLAAVGDERFVFDYVIAGTGYAHEQHARVVAAAELAGIADHVLRWRDRYQPPANERDDDLGAAPDFDEALYARAIWRRTAAAPASSPRRAGHAAERLLS